MRRSTADDTETVPPSMTPAFMASASAKALRLSPTAPALLRTVKVSPVAGAPLICTRQPFTSMLPPAVKVWSAPPFTE